MNEEQYNLLCKTCDGILLDKESSIERVSIEWLHVVREHPEFIKKYINIFNNQKYPKIILESLIRKENYLKGLVRQIILIAQAKLRNLQKIDDLSSKNIDVLIVSHCVSNAQENEVDDFYFGKLPSILVAQGQTVLLVLIDHVSGLGAKLNYNKTKQNIHKVLLPKTLSLAGELRLDKDLRGERSRLYKHANNENNELVKNILKVAAQHALSSESKMALRVGRQIGKLVKESQPKIVVTTYEGHSWERIIFAEARKANQKIYCYAYQHAPIFKHQHANCRNLGAQYNPDKILVSGAHSLKRFMNEPLLKNIPITLLGSIRAPISSEKLRFNFKENNNQKRNLAEKRCCLVLPEGIISECNLLFNYAIDCAKINPNLIFILRLHPILSIQELDINPSKLPTNVLVSNRSLNEDAEISSFVLYRGSTAVIQAIISGAIPLYLAQKNEMTINPLYEIENLILQVTNTSDFSQILKNSISIESSSLKIIQDYCKELYLPMSNENIYDSFKI